MEDPFSEWLGDTPVVPRKSVEVGWVLNTEKARFVWEAPRRSGREASSSSALHSKSLTNCPAVLDHDARLFEIACPFDLTLGCRLTTEGQMVLVDLDGDQSAVSSKVVNEHVSLLPSSQWRHPQRPLIQIGMPHLFLADEPVQLVQTPPYNHFNAEPWPGLMVSGRIPIHIWPRHMNWAFEWWDVTKPLVLRRGAPWFYVRFDAMDPSRPVKVVEAEMTQELDDYVKGLSGVTTYVKQTYTLFKTAQERRPHQLLKRKRQ